LLSWVRRGPIPALTQAVGRRLAIVVARV
jgi:hypothetical protein